MTPELFAVHCVHGLLHILFFTLAFGVVQIYRRREIKTREAYTQAIYLLRRKSKHHGT